MVKVMDFYKARVVYGKQGVEAVEYAPYFIQNINSLQVVADDTITYGYKSTDRIYVQASYIIYDKATREREFGNLRAIKDNYPKYVISMTPLLTKNDDDGITHIHLRKFLTEGL